MNFNRKKHSRFIQRLDRTAEKNPLLWLPCVVLIAFALAAEHIAEYAKIAYQHRNTEKIVKEKAEPERKPFFLRAAAVTVAASLSLMLVPVTSFADFEEEYDIITEQTVVDETSEPEEAAASEETSDPEETDVSEETSESEETAVPEEVSEPEAPTVSEEGSETEETTASEETSEPEEAGFSEEEMSYNEGINPLAICAQHNYHTTWDWDDDYHERTCAVCGWKERARHDMVITSVINPTLTTGGTKYSKCTVCPYTKTDSLPPLGNHNHKIRDDWSYDSQSHWHGCINPTCGAVENLNDHNFGEWEYYSSYSHKKVCSVCDYYYTERHDFEWKTDGEKHYEECKVCHTKRSEGAHNFKTNNDETKHWKECTFCQYIKDEEAHSLSDDWQTTPDIHKKGCTKCDYSTESAPHGSDLVWYYDDDGVEHWQYCKVCEWESAKEQHSLSWQHDDEGEFGMHWQECRCGYEINWDYHDFGGEYFDEWVYRSDNYDHWYECSDCKLKIHMEAHDWVWDSSDDVHWNVCLVCGRQGKESEHDYKWKHDNDVHWKECVCGRKLESSGHEFDDGVITIAEDGETSVRRYYCTFHCGYFYDTPLTHNHRPGDEWKYDENEHWHECISCNKKIDPVRHDYTEKVTVRPTETEKGTRVYTCRVCGRSYTEAIPEIGHVHVYDNEWHKDKSDHWHECVSCGARTDSANHAYNVKVTVQPTETENGTREYTCRVCGYSYEEEIPKLEHVHVYDTEWHTDKDDHWRECTYCGEIKDIAPHVPDGGTVTVQPTATASGTRIYRCTVCGYTVRTETIPPTGNTETSTVSYAAIDTGTRAAREPYIYGEPSKSGWGAIIAEIDSAAEGSVVKVNMNGTTELPKSAAEHIQICGVSLKLYSGSMIWTVNGSDVTDPKTVDLHISDRSSNIPQKIINTISSELEPKEYRLYHRGNFGFKASLTLNTGKKYNGHYAALYHYNTKTKQLEFVDESFVENRRVTFEITHASFYAVVFNSVPMYDDVSSGGGAFVSLVPIETSAMPETGGVTIPAAKLPQIMRYSSRKRRYRILRRRRLDDLVFVF